MRPNLSNPANVLKSASTLPGLRGLLGLWAGLLMLGASQAGANAVTITPAPGTVRASFDTLHVLATTGEPSYHREGNDFYVLSMTFRIQRDLAGTLNTAAATWTVNGTPMAGSGGFDPLNYRLTLSRSQAQALGPGPHAVKAVVQFPDTTVTAEWSVTFHAATASDARLRAQVVRANKGSGTLPDTLGYRVLQADSIDGSLFSHWSLPVALDLSGDTVRAGEIRGSLAASKGTTVDLFALRVRYAGDRSVFLIRTRGEVVDSSYAPGFTLRQALAAIKLNHEASLLVGPVFPAQGSTSSVSAKTENGWKIVSNFGYGDCPAGCIYNDQTTYQVSADPQGLKVCRTWAPPEHPSMVSTTCKVNGVSALAAPTRLSKAQAAGIPVRADGRRLPNASTPVPQLRVPAPVR